MSGRLSVLYCFDTSSYIRAWVEAYPPDVMPSFWSRLEASMTGGIVVSPEEVLRETKKRSDGLHDWLHDRKDCFADVDDELQDAVTGLLGAHPRMAMNRKGASSADAWVVGLAQVRRAIVVSEENLTDSERRPKIPGVCKTLGVGCMNLVEFMRKERWRI